MDQEKNFHLQTKHTSYIFRVSPIGKLEHLYYGKKIKQVASYIPLFEKIETEYPNAIRYSEKAPNITLDNLALEYSSIGKGDLGESACEIWSNDGSFVADFIYKGFRSYQGKKQLKALPSSHDEHNRCETIEIDLYDEVLDVTLTLYYHVFYETDVITRYVRLRNGSKTELTVKRLMSMQFDFSPLKPYQMITFNGAWAREMQRRNKELSYGIYVNDSKTGTSSNKHNPFVMIAEEECTEEMGRCYGVNLIYSGNHAEIIEVNAYQKIRVMNGINPYCFSFQLGQNESFVTPEAVLSFSDQGFNALSHNMHDFINEHIVPSTFRYRPRPVLINNWEATYFDFDEEKLLGIAKDAAGLGVELFVLDDGWFGQRNDDTSSLGDWYTDPKKLPHGLKDLAQKINQFGMDFGLWIEPEMISEKSNLYIAHPEWAVKLPHRVPALARNQLVLDLANPEVCEYLIEVLTQVISSANIKYIKWDMNRNFSDMYSPYLGSKRQGEFYHRYVLGLYKIIDTLVKRFPDVLFEGCASGGNRFDLGILCYMPQIWASDNTDAYERVKIQTGLSYGYPLSVIGAHVSACPNHQTLRKTPLETRFNIAAMGVLGYELDVRKMSNTDKEIVKEQIAFYKKHRDLLQFGTFYRIRTIYENNQSLWMIVNREQTKGILIFYQDRQIPNPGVDILQTMGLDDEKRYKLSNRMQKIEIETLGDLITQNTLEHQIDKSEGYAIEIEREVLTMYGDLLNYAGFKPKSQFNATGYNQNVRVVGDFGSRMYLFEEE